MSDIRHAIQIEASPEQVYPLVATANGLRQWWAEDVTESEGTVSLGFFNRTTIYRLRLRSQQPKASAEWVCESGEQWKDTRIAFEMEARGKGTFLRFTHGDWSDDTEYFYCCTTTWGTLMFRLKAAAEGQGRGPLFAAAGMGY
jgi:uncharacterized protein YndB with AHSA1/START domain